jgi:hypothetical protein
MICGKEVVKSHEMLQTLATGMLKVLVQPAEEIFPDMKNNMVSVLCIIGIVSSSLVNSVACVFDVPRQN